MPCASGLICGLELASMCVCSTANPETARAYGASLTSRRIALLSTRPPSRSRTVIARLRKTSTQTDSPPVLSERNAAAIVPSSTTSSGGSAIQSAACSVTRQEVELRVRFENDDRVGLSTQVGNLTITVREWEGRTEVNLHFTDEVAEDLPRVSISDARGNTYDWANPYFVH